MKGKILQGAIILAWAFQPCPWVAQLPSGVSVLEPWRFLVGDWVASGRGQPGQGTGSFSFRFELQGKILVRKNRADYPATNDHPAFSHEDLMVIYPEGGQGPVGAVYFDNEGHVVEYLATASSDGNAWTFLSGPSPSTPRFRLSYTRAKKGTLDIKFEIAPQDRPDRFSTYLEGVARRKSPR